MSDSLFTRIRESATTLWRSPGVTSARIRTIDSTYRRKRRPLVLIVLVQAMQSIMVILERVRRLYFRTERNRTAHREFFSSEETFLLPEMWQFTQKTAVNRGLTY